MQREIICTWAGFLGSSLTCQRKWVWVKETGKREGQRAGGVKQQRVQDGAVRRVHPRGRQTEEVRAGAELMSDGLVTRTLSPCPTQGHLV